MQYTQLNRLNYLRSRSDFAGWLLLLALASILAIGTIIGLWPTWRGDSGLSHGPLIPLVVLLLIWIRRKDLGSWDSANVGGLIVMCCSAVVYVAAVWADISFVKYAVLVVSIIGAIWFLGGNSAVRVCAGPVSLLLYMIPWPTLLVDRLSFPLQNMSSAYATMLGGLLGLPLQRDGVNIAVVPNLDAKEVFAILVGKDCSGLTSLMVLLALGHVCTLFTPVRTWLKLLLWAAVVPLALAMNAVRLTLILLFGAHSNTQIANWVHNNETPVLVFACSIALIAIRYGVISLSEHLDREKGGKDDSLATIDR